jgi:hypothetical protein
MLKKPETLQKQAISLIKRLRLKELLSKAGEFKIVGSVRYGLMTWRDVDIDVITQNKINESSYWYIVKKLFSVKEINLINLVNNQKALEKNRPRSLYIGLNIKDETGEIWKFDIRLLSKRFVVADRIEEMVSQKLTSKSKRIILKIKSLVHNNPKYHKEFSSVDIYEAVLLFKVENLNQFKKYLKTIGKSL